MGKQKKKIDGDIYTVTPFAGRKAFKIQMKLAKLLAPSIGSLFGMLKGSNDVKSLKIADTQKALSMLDWNIDGDIVSNAMNMLVDKYSEDELLDFMTQLLEQTEKGEQGKEVFITAEAFDTLFCQKMMTAFKVVFFVIQVNFPDFFALAAPSGEETEKTAG